MKKLLSTALASLLSVFFYCVSAQSFQVFDLSGEWELSDASLVRVKCISATVPGDVHSALLKGGIIEDTYFAENEMDALWVGGVGATIYMATSGSSNWFYFLLPVVGAHIWSFADAFFDTQWDSNPDANRFSFGILPTPDKGVAGALLMKF